VKYRLAAARRVPTKDVDWLARLPREGFFGPNRIRMLLTACDLPDRRNVLSESNKPAADSKASTGAQNEREIAVDPIILARFILHPPRAGGQTTATPGARSQKVFVESSLALGSGHRASVGKTSRPALRARVGHAYQTA